MKNKSLITITSCNRFDVIKKFIWDYLHFVNHNEHFHFVLALDGNNADYITFCLKYGIPLIYSEEREGVGLSKNRVIKKFPNYEYYFFVDDDIELLNDTVFGTCIDVLNVTGYHHLCGNHIHNLIKSETILNKTITHSTTGGGYFSCYTQKSLEVIGGWNTLFAKYKRYGHSEHTYRVMNSGLQPSPFIFVEELKKDLIVHSPPSVSDKNEANKNEWVLEEQQLINEKTTYFPLETICLYYFNEQHFGYNQKVADFIASNPQKYPLTKGKERRVALAEYYALKIPKTGSFFKKLNLLLKSIWLSPTNVALKHFIKSKFIGRK